MSQSNTLDVQGGNPNTKATKGIPATTGITSFPENLIGDKGDGHFIQFFVNEQDNAKVDFQGGGSGFTSMPAGAGATQVSVKRAPTKRLLESIALYMPAQVSLNQKSNYGEIEIGNAVAAALAGAKGGATAEEGFFNTVGGVLSGVGGSMSESATAALRKAVDVGASGAKAAFELQSGTVLNNRLETVFEGVEKREFSFQFRFLPRSENEAKTVDRIVNIFRFYMAPSFGGDPSTSRTFIVPATFNIQYHYSGGQNMFLNKIGECVLTNMDVTFGGERPQFFKPTSGVNGDGAPPVETNITLNFKELELMTREKIKEGF
tara:strand:+ start:175 stop:1131 length:957 start_codon:yes stop_codon:yes gene_type:complete